MRCGNAWNSDEGTVGAVGQEAKVRRRAAREKRDLVPVSPDYLREPDVAEVVLLVGDYVVVLLA